MFPAHSEVFCLASACCLTEYAVCSNFF